MLLDASRCLQMPLDASRCVSDASQMPLRCFFSKWFLLYDSLFNDSSSRISSLSSLLQRVPLHDSSWLISLPWFFEWVYKETLFGVSRWGHWASAGARIKMGVAMYNFWESTSLEGAGAAAAPWRRSGEMVLLHVLDALNARQVGFWGKSGNLRPPINDGYLKKLKSAK